MSVEAYIKLSALPFPNQFLIPRQFPSGNSFSGLVFGISSPLAILGQVSSHRGVILTIHYQSRPWIGKIIFS
jgi:hypothetical protein